MQGHICRVTRPVSRMWDGLNLARAVMDQTDLQVTFLGISHRRYLCIYVFQTAAKEYFASSSFLNRWATFQSRLVCKCLLFQCNLANYLFQKNSGGHCKCEGIIRRSLGRAGRNRERTSEDRNRYLVLNSSLGYQWANNIPRSPAQKQ